MDAGPTMHTPSAMMLAPHRVGAMVLRYAYLLRSSWSRLLELIYWPAVQLFVWGFLQFYIAQNSGDSCACERGIHRCGVIWEPVVSRAAWLLQCCFPRGNVVEEPWRSDDQPVATDRVRVRADDHEPYSSGDRDGSRDAAGHRILRFQCVWPGVALVAFFVNLIFTGWAVGLVVAGVLLRNGMGAESLAWTLMFVLMPLVSSLPVSVLPDWVRRSPGRFCRTSFFKEEIRH